MSVPWEDPPRKRWTLEECEKLEQDGYLIGRYELIDGEIFEKMTANPPHRIALLLLAEWLVSVFSFLQVQTQVPILLSGKNNKPEPDVAVTRQPTTEYVRTHPVPEDLLLVVEVSDTTLLYDLNTKAALYSRAGVREYWVLDVAGRQLIAHRQPTAAGYQDVRTLSEAERIAPESRPEETVLIGSLLPPATEA